MKEKMMKSMRLGMNFLKVVSVLLLLTFTATPFSLALENQNDHDILDLLPGVLAASNLNTDNDGDGYTANQGDCNDSVAAINPGATEICGDVIDQDCNGSDEVCPEDVDDDYDGDGYTENQGDCNDTNSAISPVSTEICGDGIDQDCNGSDQLCPEDIDNDGDGYSENQGDCNDTVASISPEGVEVCGDGIDQDCNGFDLSCDQNAIDNDLDGFSENQGDCNDSNATIYPGALEVCGDGIDQDCSGSDLTCSGEPNLFSDTVITYRTWDYSKNNYVDINSDPDYHFITLNSDGSFTHSRLGYCADGEWVYDDENLTLNRLGACSLGSYSTETSMTSNISIEFEGQSTDGPYRVLNMTWDNMVTGNWIQYFTIP